MPPPFDAYDTDSTTAPRPSKPARVIARLLPPESRAFALFAVKAFHSLAFSVIQTAIFYLLHKGLRRESDRRAAVAFTIAAGEVIIYAGNGFRCPLTGLAEELGAERGAVTDIFLPSWLARNVANIYTPLFALGVGLHARNVLQKRRPREPLPTPRRDERRSAITERRAGRAGGPAPRTSS